MEKNVKGLLLDSKNGEVKEIEFDGHYQSIHSLLGENVEQIQWETFSNGDMIYFDYEQDNYQKEDKGFQFASGMCKYGNGFIVGNRVGNEDDWFGSDVQLTKEQITSEVVFGKLGLVLMVIED